MLLIDDERLFVDRLGRAGRQRVSRAAGLIHGSLGFRLHHLERFVVLNFLFDPLLEGHRGQLQDLHRLDHARRKHLLLRHPHFLAE